MATTKSTVDLSAIQASRHNYLSTADVAELFHLYYNTDLSVSAIARQLGVSWMCVKHRIERAGLPARREIHASIFNPVAVQSTRVAWLAGVIDSEGWVTLIHGNRRKPGNYYLVPQVGITNTNFEMINEVVAILQECGVGHHVRNVKPNGLGKRPKKEVICASICRAEEILRLTASYLIAKRENAAILLQFIDFRRSVPLKQPYGDVEFELLAKIRGLQLRDNGKRLNP